MIEHALFITGAQRSGTTLLEKLLNAIDGVSILSQPYPLLFVGVKREFLRKIGAGDVLYPLGHLFHGTRYDAAAFSAFLTRWRTSAEQLRKLFNEMRDYSGQYTRFSPEALDEAFETITDADDFASVVSKLNRALSRKTDSIWFGSKETICEEFLPALLDRGLRCGLIIRDPRDVIASLNHGRGADFGGSPKPTLFNIRHWRKSVAHAFALEDHPRFHWCRYEDLVAEPRAELQRVINGANLGITMTNATVDLRDATGAMWRGNSSHGELSGIPDSSIGRYRSVLDPNVQRMIEAACLPELLSLGYETSLTADEAADVLEDFSEAYEVTRSGMEADYANAENARIEVRRLQKVFDSHDSESKRWFLFERAHDRLREAMAP